MTHRTDEPNIHIRIKGGSKYLVVNGNCQSKYVYVGTGDVTEAHMKKAIAIREKLRRERQERVEASPTNAWNALSDVKRYEPRIKSQAQLWGGR